MSAAVTRGELANLDATRAAISERIKKRGGVHHNAYTSKRRAMARVWIERLSSPEIAGFLTTDQSELEKLNAILDGQINGGITKRTQEALERAARLQAIATLSKPPSKLALALSAGKLVEKTKRMVNSPNGIPSGGIGLTHPTPRIQSSKGFAPGTKVR